MFVILEKQEVPGNVFILVLNVKVKNKNIRFQKLVKRNGKIFT